jgi:2'-5' RNA ligase
MAQSVELVLDPLAEAAVIQEWDRLDAAGLPSSRRPESDQDHRPHVTLYAASRMTAEADTRLPALFTELAVELRVGALMIFGPRHGSCVLVRQVVPSAELLALQRDVAQLCGADPAGQFGVGRWTPHVTLARRIRPEQLGAAVEVLSAALAGGRSIDGLSSVVRRCRRWDGDRKTAWWLTRT